MGEGGKKTGAAEAPDTAAAGRHAASAPPVAPKVASTRKARKKEFLQRRKEERADKRRPGRPSEAAAAARGVPSASSAGGQSDAADRVDEVAFNDIYHAPPDLGKGSRRARSTVASEGGRHARAFERLVGREGGAPNLADADERLALRQHLIDSYRAKRGGGLFDRHRKSK